MTQLERARALLAAGRHVAGLTELLPEAPPCEACRKAGRDLPALVIGRTLANASGAADTTMCPEHFASEGSGLGADAGRVVIPTGPFLEVECPTQTEPAGYARAILDYRLAVLPPDRLTFIAPKGQQRTSIREGRTTVVLPPGYRPGSALSDQLLFALKYDGVNLQVLSALFRRVDLEGFEKELCSQIRRRPTGQYVRRLWFLYELLTERRLRVEDLAIGNYVPLLDPERYYSTPGVRSRRHRILDNLLGTARFCPMVRRTERLANDESDRLAEEAARIVAEFDEDAIRRAVSYLYTKETRSSFGIEGEHPSPSRAERFVTLLRDVPAVDTLTHEVMARLQNATVDPRFADSGYRTDQVYIGKQIDLVRQKIHFVAPRPQAVPSLMDGWLQCLRRIEGSSLDAVIQAAAIAFGFVFIHPFSDGNGRLHRLLIHYILARRGFTPKTLIFPVSAVMLQRRHEYDETLEAFSVPLMRVTDYEVDDEGVVTVSSDTSHLYRFFDATPMAEALYEWVRQTVRDEFRRELEFVVGFREIRRELESIVGMPDRQANLFVKLCLQNDGRLSPAKRHHFSRLTDQEIGAMEKAVQAHLGSFPRLPSRPGTTTIATNGFRRTEPSGTDFEAPAQGETESGDSPARGARGRQGSA